VVAGGGWWWLVVAGGWWWLVAAGGGGWWWLVVGGWCWWLVAGGWRWLVVVAGGGVPHWPTQRAHRTSPRAQGIPLIMGLEMDSPTKLTLTTADAMKDARRHHGALDEKEQVSFMNLRKKTKSLHLAAVGPELKNRFGGVFEFCARRSREALQQSGIYGQHSVWVCGKPIIDSDTQTIGIAFSSENLLLNAVRQTRFGFPSIVQVDCTYRLVLEGHNNMLFGTVDPSQHFHIIGYGICSKEDTAMHTHIAKCLKNVIELVHKERMEKEESI
jgi:hypothetical protein